MRKILMTAVAAAPLFALSACAGDAGPYDSAYGPGDRGWFAYDADRDGVVNEQEYAAIGDDFDTIDADDSGYIDEREYGMWSNEVWENDYGGQQSATLFDEWDENDDFGLTEDEWADDDSFMEWDEDDNGVLEDDEGLF
jgi:hypothetical protein